MRIEVRFLAPVPIGNEIVVQWIETKDDAGAWTADAPIILDRTSGIIWAGNSLPAALDAARFAIEEHDPNARRAKEMTNGVVTGCIVTSRGAGKYNHLVTVLHIEPSTAPYR